mgnify:CR=1 FL=1
MAESKNPATIESKKPYYELEDIREDIESLKTNVVELTHHIQENGMAVGTEIAKNARRRLLEVRERGQEQFNKIEKQIKEKPAQSLAVAFATGFVASYLFGHRR